MNMRGGGSDAAPFAFIRLTARPCANEWFSIEVGGHSSFIILS